MYAVDTVITVVITVEVVVFIFLLLFYRKRKKNNKENKCLYSPNREHNSEEYQVPVAGGHTDETDRQGADQRAQREQPNSEYESQTKYVFGHDRFVFFFFS